MTILLNIPDLGHAQKPSGGVKLFCKNICITALSIGGFKVKTQGWFSSFCVLY